MENNERKTLFSRKVSAGGRTYFFDVKEATSGDKYLVINESRESQDGQSYERNRIMVFEGYLASFYETLKDAIEFIEGDKDGDKRD
jgi:hypothetical protein